MLSIIVPSNKPASCLEPLLHSLKDQSLSRKHFEIIVVFNNKSSTKELAPWAQELPIRWTVAPNPGVNHARNHGAHMACGDPLLFLDDDCRLPSNQYLETLKHLHDTEPHQLSFGGCYQLPEKATGYWTQAYYEIMKSWLHNNHLPKGYSNHLLGGSASYKKSLFQEGLQFDPSIVYGSSELSLNVSIYRKYGPHRFLKELNVIHDSPLNWIHFAKKAFAQGQGFQKSKLTIEGLEHHTPPTSSPKGFEKAARIYSLFFVAGTLHSEGPFLKDPSSLLRSWFQEYSYEQWKQRPPAKKSLERLYQ